MASKPPLSLVRFAGSTAYISGQLPRGADGKIIAGNMQNHIPRVQPLYQRWLRPMPWWKLKLLPVGIANKGFAIDEKKQE